MSGPCTDCGGPDYQTLMARIAELEAELADTEKRFAAIVVANAKLLDRIAALEAVSMTSICIFCGATMEKDLAVMLDHAEGCEKRPENRLMLQIAELEAALADANAQLDRIDPSRLVDRGEA